MQALRATTTGANPKYRLDLALPPEPFLGLHDAPLVTLLANPGRSESDPAAYARPGITPRTLHNIATDGGTPNHFLSGAEPDHPGSLWWRRTLRGLTTLGHSYEELSRTVLALQFHGYHSPEWRPIPFTLPSQSFTFDLVRRAMSRDAVIILGRIADVWTIAIPELRSYPNVVTPKTRRNAAISRGMFTPQDFERITDALAV
ncbi:hypothetical protein [Streptomyces sp. NBC_01465]|uniref:hypothetical protein n=1 Tax=Streptomyces sp. NBC_01465 TaxID=2903878 RepID=UPI002E353351|nr:hypothetical protein [Streptomyces sp. NBC_01465]